MLVYRSFIFLFCLLSHANELDEKKIYFLLDQIKNSEAIFIRNGSTHTAKEAYKHIKAKYERVRDGFWFFSSATEVSVQDFIDKIASHSSTSGKAYHIRLPSTDNKDIEMKTWLTQQLAKYNSDAKK